MIQRFCFCLAAMALAMPVWGQGHHHHHDTTPPDGGPASSANSSDLWAFEYRLMSMGMKDLLSGKSDLLPTSVLGTNSAVRNSEGNPYMITATSMTMNMHMLMGTYTQSPALTWMVMLNYIQSSMDMIMQMNRNGTTTQQEMTMEVSGIGDTEVMAMFNMDSAPGDTFTIDLGLNLPTGDIEETDRNNGQRLPYGMRLGSGTFDLKPGATFIRARRHYQYGLQGSYTLRMGDNSRDYNMGDRLDISAFSQIDLKEFSLQTTLDFSDWDEIQGRDTDLALNSTTNDPKNYGGTRLDLSVGVTLTPSKKFITGIKFATPIIQDLNGVQPKTSTILNFWLSYTWI